MLDFSQPWYDAFWGSMQKQGFDDPQDYLNKTDADGNPIPLPYNINSPQFAAAAEVASVKAQEATGDYDRTWKTPINPASKSFLETWAPYIAAVSYGYGMVALPAATEAVATASGAGGAIGTAAAEQAAAVGFTAEELALGTSGASFTGGVGATAAQAAATAGTAAGATAAASAAAGATEAELAAATAGVGATAAQAATGTAAAAGRAALTVTDVVPYVLGGAAALAATGVTEAGEGATTVTPPPGATSTATYDALQEEYLALIRDMRNRTGAFAESDADRAARELSTATLQEYLRTLPAEQAYRQAILDYQTAQLPAEQAYRTASLALLTAQVEAQIAGQAKELQRQQDMFELANITGDLTSEEKGMFQQMADNTIAKITNSLNKEKVDVMDTAIANLVDKGVLQGSIGAEVLGKIGERTQELLAQATTDVETQKMTSMLQTIEANKNRALQWYGMGMQVSQIRTGIAQYGYQGATTSQDYLGSAIGSQQYAAGLQASVNQNVLGAQGSLLGSWASQRESEANRALQASIANAQTRAQSSAGMWGAFGNIAGLGALSYMRR